MKYFCHKLADVQSNTIGDDTKVWQFSIILERAKIGKNCNINANVFIENDVVVGNNVTIKSGVQIWDGITLEDNVFVGPNVTFTNDLVPRSKQYPTGFAKTLIKKGASIGANATIIAGNEIGAFSMIGAGAVVTKNIGKNELWVGNPAKQIGFITQQGEILDLELKSKESNKKYCWNKGLLILSND